MLNASIKLLTVLALVVATPLRLLAADSYPESALRDALENEATERTRAEELERQKARKDAEYERHVKEIEDQIQSKRIQTEGYKAKSEELLNQLESINVELFELRVKKGDSEKDIQENEQKYQKIQADYDKAKKDHAEQQSILEQKQAELKTLKEKVEKQVVKNRIEIQKMKQDLAVIETEIASADAQKAKIESDEMQTRVEWLAVRKELNDKRELKAAYVEQAQQSQKKLLAAKKDLSTAQSELEKAGKETNQIASRTKADVQKYEKEMQEYSRKKAMAQAEKLRLESESEKLKNYSAQVRLARDEAAKQFSNSNDAMIESRIALETTKTELTGEIAEGQKAQFDNQKTESRLRGLASAAEASQYLDGGRLFITSKVCPAYRRPSSASDEVLQLQSGRKLLGQESIGSWIKITSEGRSVFVDNSCGKFED